VPAAIAGISTRSPGSFVGEQIVADGSKPAWCGETSAQRGRPQLNRKAHCDKRLARDDLLHLADLVLPGLDDLLGEAGGVYVLAIGDFGVGQLD
jgi:hypothetical protein